MAKDQADDVLNLRRKARRRLIGAVALTLAVVVVLPMVLESEPKPAGKDIDLRIPSPNKVGEFVPGTAVSETPETAPPDMSKVVTTAIPLTAPVVAVPAPAQEAIKPAPVPQVAPSKAPEHQNPEAQKGIETQKPAETANPAETKGADNSGSAENYVAQVGAYSNQRAAKQELKKLKKWGFKAYIEKSGDKVRVRVGPYTDRDKAEKVVRLLEKHGLHPVVMSVQ
jgi:DedD protein